MFLTSSSTETELRLCKQSQPVLARCDASRCCCFITWSTGTPVRSFCINERELLKTFLVLRHHWTMTRTLALVYQNQKDNNYCLLICVYKIYIHKGALHECFYSTTRGTIIYLLSFNRHTKHVITDNNTYSLNAYIRR